MSASKDMLTLMQQIASQTIDAMALSDIVVGEVVSTAPLAIKLEKGLTIPEAGIRLTKNTCLWSVDMTVDHNTENAAGGSGDSAYESHHHGYKGTKTYLVHNELQVGDKVYLLRESGGQHYVALDRVYNPNRGCSD